MNDDSTQGRSRIMSLLEAAQHMATGYAEIYPGGQPVTMPSPRIVGPGRCPPIQGVTRKVFLAAFHDAVVRSRFDGIEVSGRMLFDYQGREIDNIVAECPRDKFFCDGTDVFALHQAPFGPTIDIPEALMLVGNNSVNFGHWWIEHLLQVATVADRPELRGVPIVIDADLPASHRQALEYFTGGAAPVIELPQGAAARVRRLWKASNWIYVPFYWSREEAIQHEFIVWPLDEVAARFRKLGSAIHLNLSDSPFSKRVFLSRRHTFHRKLVNLKEIEEIARGWGFEIYNPEDLDFVNQLRLIAGASHIIGPEGSAFFLALFGKEGAELCAFDHPFIEKVGYAAALYPKFGIKLLFLTGNCVRKDTQFIGFSDYLIDPSDVERVLSEWDLRAPHVA